MPRIPRGQTAGYAYHVINRGNARTQVFHKAEDYKAFVELLAGAKARHRVKIFAFCLRIGLQGQVLYLAIGHPP